MQRKKCLVGKGVAEKWTVKECREELRNLPNRFPDTAFALWLRGNGKKIYIKRVSSLNFSRTL